MDEPCERSMHECKTPTLGGVGLFLTFSLGLILISLSMDFGRLELVRVLALLGATILLLFLGLKDDLLVISPRKKFSGQLVAAALVIFASDVRIISMDGIFGLGTLPYAVSTVFTIFVFLLVINAFNLIDGIDGLAGGIGILVCTFFGCYFMLNGAVLMGLTSFLLIGALLGFLRYNLSKEKKMFMGDSGSLFTGFLLAYLTVTFLKFSAVAQVGEFSIDNAPVLAIAALSYPLMDTLRVFIIRIREGRSPFSADKNHIHHRFSNLGFSHKMASTSIIALNLLVIALALGLQSLNIHIQLLICVLGGVCTYLLPFYAIKKQGAKRLQSVDLNKIYQTPRVKLKTREKEAPGIYDDELTKVLKEQQEAVSIAKKEGALGQRLGIFKKFSRSMNKRQVENKI